MDRRHFTFGGIGTASLAASGARGAKATPGGMDASYAADRGVVTPECFGAAGDGTTDDTEALVSWAAHGGPLAATPARSYFCASLVSGGHQLAFADHSHVDGHGATIIFGETDESNNQRGLLEEGSTIRDLGFLWRARPGGDAGHYFGRFLSMRDDTALIDVSFRAEAHQPKSSDDAGYDSCLRWDGARIRMVRVLFDGIYRCADGWAGGEPYDILVKDCHIRSYASGFSLHNARAVTIDGLIVEGKSLFSDPTPGQNAITGGSDKLVIRNVVVSDAAEHAIYLSSGGTLESPSRNLLVENISVQSSGQCALKIRGWADFVMRNCFGANAHRGSKAGSNEDGLRFEECLNGRIWNFGHGDNAGDGNGGHDIIHIDSCQDLHFYTTHAEAAQRAFVRIEDTRVPGSVRQIHLHGFTALDAPVPVLDICTNGEVDAVSMTGLWAEGHPGPLVRLDGRAEIKNVHVQCLSEIPERSVQMIVGGGDVVVQKVEARTVATGTSYRPHRVSDIKVAEANPERNAEVINAILEALRQSGMIDG